MYGPSIYKASCLCVCSSMKPTNIKVEYYAHIIFYWGAVKYPYLHYLPTDLSKPI